MRCIIRFFSSIRVAIALLTAIAVACAVAACLQEDAAWEWVFSTWWFNGLLATLVVAVAVCRVRRRPKGLRQMGSFLMHASLVLILAGAMLGGMFGQWGILELHVGETQNAARTDRDTFPLGFRVTLKDFTIERYPSGMPEQFVSTVIIDEEGQKGIERTISVNQPLKYAGYSFYQAKYDEQGESWSGFLVRRDPYKPIVYVGFVGLILGLSIAVLTHPKFREHAEAPKVASSRTKKCNIRKRNQRRPV